MEREREHRRLTTEPKIDLRFLFCDFKVTPCTLDDCEGPAKCLFKHPGEQGRRDLRQFKYYPKLCSSYIQYGSCHEGNNCQFAHGHLESWFHPREFSGIGALKFEFDRYVRMGPLRPLPTSQSAAIQLILDLKSTGQLCDDILLDRSYNEMEIYRAARDAMSKHGYGLPKTATASTFPNPFGWSVRTTESVVPQWDSAVPFPMGNRFGKMAPQVCGGDAYLPTDHGMVEPGDLKPDSGASNHVDRETTLLHGYERLDRPSYMNVADGYGLEVLGIGSIKTEKFYIPGVRRVKGLQSNLISVSQLATDHGLLSVFDRRTCKIFKQSDLREPVGAGFLQANGIYKLSFLYVPEADDSGYENA